MKMFAAQHGAVSAVIVLFVAFCPPLSGHSTHPAVTPPAHSKSLMDDAGSEQLKRNEVHLVRGVPHQGEAPVIVSTDQGLIPDLTYDVPHTPEQRDAGLPLTITSQDDLKNLEDRIAREGVGIPAQDQNIGSDGDAADQSPGDYSQGANRREKRGIVINDETRFWTKGIVPYVFSSELSESDKNAIFYAMEFISNHTCSRFLPWDSNTKRNYGLANGGHLRFINRNGCWSSLGNKYYYYQDYGQDISCCTAAVCIHELGHALGLRHEQSHYDNKGWLRRNWFKQAPDMIYTYSELQPGTQHRFTPYDISSPMHYGVRSSSKEMTMLFPEMETKVKYHRFFKLISDTYKCQARHCSSFSPQCQNNGFVTLAKGQCSCVCPDGLDPATGCTTQRTKFEAQTFPGGSYALLAPPEGCPDRNGFQSGLITHTYNLVVTHQPYKLLGVMQGEVANTQFCVKQSQYQNEARWPRGEYCVHRVGSCPAGFYESTITMGTKPNGNSKSGTTPDADITTGSVKFYYCCRRDGIVAEPVDFANTKPFALVQQSAWGCQQIKGMGVYARAYSLMDPLLSDVFSASADGPRNFRSTETGETFFYYCYYYPRSDNSFPMPTCADREGQCPSLANSGQCHVPSVLTSCPYSCNTCPGPQGGSGTCTDTDSTCDPASCASYSTAQLEGCKFTCRQCPEFCGGMITLTDTDRSRTITSPNYPVNYDNSMDCFWQIKGPEDSSLVMKFDDFDLAGSGFSCSDNLDINYGLQGQEGLHYCGQDMFETIRSIDNVIEMRLITDFRNTGKGFNATVTLVSPEDHCYDLGKSGQNYRGNVNYTRDFKTCLPWDEVKHCRHSAYAPYDLLDGLDKNYCRNPGDGLRPWCYYESGKCRRNYCDVCGLESAYDTIDDCDAFKTAGSCANEAEARAKCARTCQDQLPAPNTAAYADIQCTSPPTSPPDGTPTTTLQGPYSLGDTVTFTCSDTPSFFRLTTCLSDGSWSPIGYACGGCPEDWAYYRGHCYKEQREAMDYNNARGRCESLGADMVEARDEEAIRFLILLRDDGHRQWMGLKRDHTRGYHVWQDGTEPTPSFWNARDARGSDCAVLQADKTWVSFYCENEALFVCRLQARVAGVCADLISNCASRIADDPAVCTDQPDFAQLLCPNSCHIGNCQGAVSDPCSPSPCQNGGTCQVQSGSYTCTCADQYEGTNCQTMTVSDPCFPSPCQNGGSCQVQSGSYTCTCTDQYEGTNCQTMTVSDPCSPSPCQNGGSCQVQSGSYTCTCSNEYEGTNCQREAVQAVGGCVDTGDSCSTWVTQGGCTGPRKHYVLHACRDSCGFCDDNAAACVDRNTYCAYWADEYDPPQCPVNPGYMLPNCQKSCGLCDGEGCVDQQSNCYQLAQRGECESNDSVKAVCPHACGLCFNPLCPDLAEDCSVRAAQGDCSLYPEDMESTCPYSCGKCREYMSNPCYGAPCQHGGTCTVDTPCHHGGTCTVDTTNTNGFTCTCAEGYLGDTCASKEPDPVATCAAGWSQSQGACYKRSTGRQKYDQAQAECATGMASSVATIKSEEEKNFVNNLAGTIVWLGGDKRDKADFTWSDGTLVKDGYSAWRKGEPNGKVGTLSDVNCMIMTSRGQWVDYTCTDRKRFFVCKYPLS